MERKIIWSLFDSETAITQQLNSDVYKVYSIGLASEHSVTDSFISIDLSRKSCIRKLNKLPRPDIIFASPPCESWVTVNSGSLQYFPRNYKEYNLYWQRDFKGLDFTKEYRKRRLDGQKTAYWTYRIIDVYKPDVWVIENGASSLIFKYLMKYFNLQGYRNFCCYSSYDNINFSEKPTVFYSNREFPLKRNKKKSILKVASRGKEYNKNFIFHANYCERSTVPLGVYKDILRQIERPRTLNLELK